MKNKVAMVPACLIILTLLLMLPINILPAKGQLVGLVSLSPSSSAACPAPPVTISSPVGTQMSVYVIIQGSSGLDGFDITLLANHTIVKPADARLDGSILSRGIILDKCIGGRLKGGPLCSSTDTVDTIHFAATSPLGSPLTFAPTTGLLFTAVYNVTGTTTTPISFQTGCSPSSVNGTTTCVVIANGTPVPAPETIRAASYVATPSPTFAIGSSRTEITLGKGQTTNSTISLISLNGFAGNFGLSVSVTPSEKHPPSFLLSPATLNLVSGGTATSFFIVTTASNTDKVTYSVTITATGGGVSGSIQVPVSVIP